MRVHKTLLHTRVTALTVSQWGSRRVCETCGSTAASWPSHAGHSELTPAQHWQVGRGTTQGQCQWRQSRRGSTPPPWPHHHRGCRHRQTVPTRLAHAPSPTTRPHVSLYSKHNHRLSQIDLHHMQPHIHHAAHTVDIQCDKLTVDRRKYKYCQLSSINDSPMYRTKC